MSTEPDGPPAPVRKLSLRRGLSNIKLSGIGDAGDNEPSPMSPAHHVELSAPSAPPGLRTVPRDSESALLFRVLRREAAMRRRWKAIEDRLNALGDEALSAAAGGKVRAVKVLLASNLSMMLKFFAQKWDPAGTGQLTLPVFLAAMRDTGFELSVGDGKNFWAELGPDVDGRVPISKLGALIRQTGFEIDSAVGGEAAMIGSAEWYAKKKRTLRKYASANAFREERRGQIGLKVDLREHENKKNNTVQMRMRRALAAHMGKVVTLFNAWDADGNGQIDRDEFFFALKLLGLAPSRAVADAVFAEFDSDGSGLLDYRELRAQLHAGDLDGDRLPRRGVAFNGCRQRQIVELPALARGDLRERAQPAREEEDEALDTAELHSFLLALLEQQRELEQADARAAEGARASADAAAFAHGGMAHSDQGWQYAASAGACAGSTSSHDADSFARAAATPGGRAQLAAQAGADGWASAVSIASERSRGSVGRTLYATEKRGPSLAHRRSLGAGGAARGGGAPAHQQLGGLARPSTARAATGGQLGAGWGAARGGQRQDAKQDESDYLRLWHDPTRALRPTMGADAAAAGLAYYVAKRAEELSSPGAPAHGGLGGGPRHAARPFTSGAARGPTYSVLAHGSAGSHGGAIYAPPGPVEMLAAVAKAAKRSPGQQQRATLTLSSRSGHSLS